MSYNEVYKLWTKKVTDADISRLLKEMAGDETAIKNAFYKELSFGTAGARGEIGAGTNCMNIYTVGKITAGIARYMVASGLKTAAISYDSRINSDLFASVSAGVFAAAGITVHLTPELQPTPYLSYLVRVKKADIGVMVTASHNPAKYNGYKVYGSDGCQLTDIYADEITGYIAKTDIFDVKTMSLEEGISAGLIKYVGDDVTEAYLAEVQKCGISAAKGLKIAFTPLNGTGYKLVPEILRRIGVEQIDIQKEQSMPDGNFTTCPYPNPEKKEALELGLQLAAIKESDLLIATDPDADRMGIAVRCGDEYRLMSGNEVGVLMTDYLFARKKENGTLPEKPVIVKSIVTTDLAFKVAAKYGAEMHNKLTGFKYIGSLIKELEEKGEQGRFVIGFEESYGYLCGTYVRDKDAVAASMLIAEIAAYYKERGMTLVDRMNELYKEFGTYQHKIISFEFPGADGSAQMARLLSGFRDNLPSEIAGRKVVSVTDYLNEDIAGLPKADVLTLKLDGGDELIVRPSGTEPFIKFYITACKTPQKNALLIADIISYIEKTFK